MSIPAATTHYGRRGLWRWAVALVATVMLVVSGSGLVVFAQSGAGESRGPQFVPAGATAYVEARMDMPDGQAEALAEFMTAFPGFADAGAFDMKLDEVLDGLVGDMTDGALAYSGEMESFITGEIGLALMDVVDASMSGGEPEMLIGIAVSDRAGAESFIELLTADPETPIVEEIYSDTSIFSKDDASLAVTDEWLHDRDGPGALEPSWCCLPGRAVASPLGRPRGHGRVRRSRPGASDRRPGGAAAGEHGRLPGGRH